MSEKFEPWFGTRPPEFRNESEGVEMGKQKSVAGKVFSFPNILLGLAVIVGLVLLLPSLQLGAFWHDLGTALIIAGIIGLVIDNYLKQRLAKEAVEAALGYVLPDPLKEEMRWVVGLKLLAIEHTVDYYIRANEDGKTVTLSIEMTRRLKNFTDTTQSIKPSLSTDEMGIEGKPSRIETFCYRLENQPWKYIDVSETKYKGDTLEITANKEEKIPSHKWIEIKAKFQETKQINDVHFMVLTHPTVQPTISIQADKGIEYRRGFTHRNGQPQDGLLQGTLLPYHSIYVRWWPSK